MEMTARKRSHKTKGLEDMPSDIIGFIANSNINAAPVLRLVSKKIANALESHCRSTAVHRLVSCKQIVKDIIVKTKNNLR
jgi:hypothetical protein